MKIPVVRLWPVISIVLCSCAAQAPSPPPVVLAPAHCPAPAGSGGTGRIGYAVRPSDFRRRLEDY